MVAVALGCSLECSVDKPNNPAWQEEEVGLDSSYTVVVVAAAASPQAFLPLQIRKNFRDRPF